jgi:hypothetical protein
MRMVGAGALTVVKHFLRSYMQRQLPIAVNVEISLGINLSTGNDENSKKGTVMHICIDGR